MSRSAGGEAVPERVRRRWPHDRPRCGGPRLSDALDGLAVLVRPSVRLVDGVFGGRLRFLEVR